MSSWYVYYFFRMDALCSNMNRHFGLNAGTFLVQLVLLVVQLQCITKLSDEPWAIYVQ